MLYEGSLFSCSRCNEILRLPDLDLDLPVRNNGVSQILNARIAASHSGTSYQSLGHNRVVIVSSFAVAHVPSQRRHPAAELLQLELLLSARTHWRHHLDLACETVSPEDFSVSWENWTTLSFYQGLVLRLRSCLDILRERDCCGHSCIQHRFLTPYQSSVNGS